MKRFILSALLVIAMPACAIDMLPTIPVNDTSPMHDMQTMETLKFRQEQIDYYNDVKSEKKRLNQKAKQPTQELQEKIQQTNQRANQLNRQSEFVEENGQIKIKYFNK